MKAEDVDPGLVPFKGKRRRHKDLSNLSDKHILDKMRHAVKEAVNHAKYLTRNSLRPVTAGWSPVGWMLDSVDHYTSFLDRAFEELERRNG